MTYKEIIVTAVRKYCDDPKERALYKDDTSGKLTCVYRSESGKTCIVGQFIPEEKYQPIWDINASTVGELEFETLVESSLKPEDTFFWGTLQDLHDCDHYWDKKGISPAGMVRLKKICEDKGVSFKEVAKELDLKKVPKTLLK